MIFRKRRTSIMKDSVCARQDVSRTEIESDRVWARIRLIITKEKNSIGKTELFGHVKRR
jgi:hypothetical protein